MNNFTRIAHAIVLSLIVLGTFGARAQAATLPVATVCNTSDAATTHNTGVGATCKRSGDNGLGATFIYKGESPADTIDQAAFFASVSKYGLLAELVTVNTAPYANEHAHRIGIWIELTKDTDTAWNDYLATKK